MAALNSSMMLNDSISSKVIGHGQFSGIGAQAHSGLEQMLLASARSSVNNV